MKKQKKKINETNEQVVGEHKTHTVSIYTVSVSESLYARRFWPFAIAIERARTLSHAPEQRHTGQNRHIQSYALLAIIGISARMRVCANTEHTAWMMTEYLCIVDVCEQK